MSTSGAKAILMLLLLMQFYTISSQESCVIPDETTSGIIVARICEKSKVDNGSRCHINCGGGLTTFICHNGLFYQLSVKKSNLVNMNTYCKKNCELGILPKHTSISQNCHKWNFAGKICRIYCPYKQELAALTCPNGLLLHADDSTGGPAEIPEQCPNAQCFDNTPGESEHTKSINCSSSTRCLYECKDTFRLAREAEKSDEGFGILTCESGVWTIPNCEKKCINLPAIANGFYLDKNCEETEEKICAFSCENGFIPQKNFPSKLFNGILTHYTRCDIQGLWNPYPACFEKRDCYNKPVVAPGTNIKIMQCHPSDKHEKCNFVCESKRNKPGTVNPPGNVFYSGIIKCDINGWEKPVCKSSETKANKTKTENYDKINGEIDITPTPSENNTSENFIKFFNLSPLILLIQLI